MSHFFNPLSLLLALAVGSILFLIFVDIFRFLKLLLLTEDLIESEKRTKNKHHIISEDLHKNPSNDVHTGKKID